MSGWPASKRHIRILSAPFQPSSDVYAKSHHAIIATNLSISKATIQQFSANARFLPLFAHFPIFGSLNCCYSTLVEPFQKIQGSFALHWTLVETFSTLYSTEISKKSRFRISNSTYGDTVHWTLKIHGDVVQRAVLLSRAAAGHWIKSGHVFDQHFPGTFRSHTFFLLSYVCMYRVPPRYCPALVKEGDDGDNVREWQQLLRTPRAEESSASNKRN